MTFVRLSLEDQAAVLYSGSRERRRRRRQGKENCSVWPKLRPSIPEVVTGIPWPMIGVPNVVAPWDELARKLLIHRQGWLSALRILLAESRITVPFAMGEPPSDFAAFSPSDWLQCPCCVPIQRIATCKLGAGERWQMILLPTRTYSSQFSWARVWPARMCRPSTNPTG